MTQSAPRLPEGLTGFCPPALTQDRLARILAQDYGLTGRLDPLAGERDQNIRVTGEDGTRYLLKVASPQEDPASIAFQIAALDHLATADPDLAIPRNIPTLSGAPSLRAPGEGGAVTIRLLSFVAGRPLAGVDPLPADAIAQTGDLMGRVNRAFRGLAPPAPGPVMPWNILNGLITAPHLIDSGLPDSLRADCLRALQRMKTHSFAAMRALPAGVIHNDAHTGNILVDADTGTRVAGLIDFGDILRGPLVQDVGSTLSSFAEIRPDLVALSADYIRALSRHVAFPDAQVALVFDALLARLILTVQLTRFRMQTIGASGVTGTDLPRVIDTLAAVLARDPARFTRDLRDALSG